MKPNQLGVTLVELMVTVAVVAILAAIAYPSYQSQIRKAHRSEAKSALLQVQVTQEKRMLQSNAYVTTTAGISDAWSAGGLGIPTTTLKYYTLSIATGATSTSYQAVATATGAQAGDTQCASFTLSSTGARGATSTGCW